MVEIVDQLDISNLEGAYPGFLTKKFLTQQGFTTPRLRIAGEGKMATVTSVELTDF